LGGTHVIQTRTYENQPVYALVTKTGFLTTKGSLVRDILYPAELRFKFYEEAMKFIGIMAIMAVIGFCIIFPILIELDTDTETLIDRSLNLVVIAVPPALPAAMQIGMIYALHRLRKQKIFCISPLRVNVAGTITTFVFDKTGTLTEDGLAVQGFRLSFEQSDSSKHFRQFSSTVTDLVKEEILWEDEATRQSRRAKFIETMASCTAITDLNGTLIGDPLDVRMFESSGWTLTEPHTKAGSADEGVLQTVSPKETPAHKIDLIRRFDFSSQLQRMSVICKSASDQKLSLYVKGSPEMIKDLCIDDTLPADYDSILE
jgi:cation-transporting ATPase 13A2